MPGRRLGEQEIQIIEGRRELEGIMEMFYIMTEVVVMSVHTFVKTHQTVHLKSVHLL